MALRRQVAFDDEEDLFEDFPADQAQQAAEAWAHQSGQPDAAELLARKLRVGWEVRQRRMRRTGRR
jgi:hypothetical protein